MSKRLDELIENSAEMGLNSDERAVRIQRKVDKNAKAFIKDVRDFLKRKNNGEIPAEWLMSVQLLEVYYRQFLQCSYEIEDLPSLIVDSRYGPTEHPLLKVLNAAAVRLEKYMGELGLSLKAASKLEIAKPVVEETPLDGFIKAQSKDIEKRSGR